MSLFEFEHIDQMTPQLEQEFALMGFQSFPTVLYFRKGVVEGFFEENTMSISFVSRVVSTFLLTP